MRAVIAGLGLLLGACLSPPASSERAADAARTLNVAARFGRMEQALLLTSEAGRKIFEEHRKLWGTDIRVFDVELASFTMKDGYHAMIEVDYSWSRVSEADLRTTRVSQEFRDPGGGFKLVREKRLSGDVGLFGEAMDAAPTERRHDTQFATKTIQ